MFQVELSTEFGMCRTYSLLFSSKAAAEAWLTGHSFEYHKGNWAGPDAEGNDYYGVELQFSDPGYRTFFGKV